MFFMTFQWFLTIFAFYRMKKYQIVQFYVHLYLKRGLGPSLSPGFWIQRSRILSEGMRLMFFMTFQWFLTIFAFYRMKKFQIVQFYAHLYLKRGLGPSLAPNCGPCIGPVLVEIVLNDIIVSLTFNFSPPNHHVVVSEKRSFEFPSENAKFGHFWANRPTFCPH